MEHLAKRLAEVPPGATSVDFARRSGVGRTTLHRIAAGKVEPTLATLRELAIAHGYELTVDLAPLSDPHAAAALRHLVDPAFEGVTPEEVSPEGAGAVRDWVTRLERYDDLDVAAVTAARASSLLHRKGGIYLRGDNSAKRLASAGSASGQEWAISAALQVVTGADVSGPSVLWVDGDAAATSRLLLDTHRRVENAAAANVVVATAHPSVFVDEYRDGPIRYVAPIQLLLDCIGLGGGLEASALLVQQSWSQAEVT
jgi:transcriptional regulator with XRE-family HTH domain